MKHLFMACILLMTLLVTAVESSKDEAPINYTLDLLATCEETSLTEEITEQKRAKLLLACVNSQLKKMNYSKVKSLAYLTNAQVSIELALKNCQAEAITNHIAIEEIEDMLLACVNNKLTSLSLATLDALPVNAY